MQGAIWNTKMNTAQGLKMYGEGDNQGDKWPQRKAAWVYPGEWCITITDYRYRGTGFSGDGSFFQQLIFTTSNSLVPHHHWCILTNYEPLNYKMALSFPSIILLLCDSCHGCAWPGVWRSDRATHLKKKNKKNRPWNVKIHEGRRFCLAGLRPDLQCLEQCLQQIFSQLIFWSCLWFMCFTW